MIEMKTFLCSKKKDIIRTVRCFIGSPLQPAGVSYIRYHARRHLTVFSWALKNISRIGSWKRKFLMPYWVLVTRGRVYYPCQLKDMQHRRLDKGNVVTPPLKTRLVLASLCKSESPILLNASIPLKN